LFQGGINVPFIARWPGKVGAGEIDDRSLISAVDLLPTFCEIAGVKLPASYVPDGVSQVEALKGKSSGIREKPLYWKMGSAWPIPESRPYHWVSYAIVDQKWKLMANRDLDYFELYDIVGDPFEKVDRAKGEPEVVEQLLGKVNHWKATLPEKPTGNVFSEERKQL
jgi:N-acetylgalactosamine-6-sulfatase